MPDQTGTNRIQHDIAKKLNEVVLALDMVGVIAILKEMTAEGMTPIELAGVLSIQG